MFYVLIIGSKDRNLYIKEPYLAPKLFIMLYMKTLDLPSLSRNVDPKRVNVVHIEISNASKVSTVHIRITYVSMVATLLSQTCQLCPMYTLEF